MAASSNLFGLSAQAKARLIEKLSSAAASRVAPAPPQRRRQTAPGETGRLDVAELESYRELRLIEEAADYLGIDDPFFRVHDGIAGAETVIGNRTYINFASYNYIGLNGDPRIAAAAKAAIDRYGTSVSASRPVSGERPVHRDLERALARIHGAEDSIALVGGHSTNVTVIGHLLGRNDLVVHDSLIHNSIVQGAMLSGARRAPFRHLDPEAADRILADARPRHGRALLVIEGHYSMDGDVPDLAAFVAVARRHRAWLMVDEAHALGVLGPPPRPHRGGTAGSVRDARRSRRRARATSDPRRPRTARSATGGHTRTARTRVAWRRRGRSSRSPRSHLLDHSRKTSSSSFPVHGFGGVHPAVDQAEHRRRRRRPPSL